jgi:hypothetical protein
LPAASGLDVLLEAHRTRKVGGALFAHDPGVADLVKVSLVGVVVEPGLVPEL